MPSVTDTERLFALFVRAAMCACLFYAPFSGRASLYAQSSFLAWRFWSFFCGAQARLNKRARRRHAPRASLPIKACLVFACVHTVFRALRREWNVDGLLHSDPGVYFVRHWPSKIRMSGICWRSATVLLALRRFCPSSEQIFFFHTLILSVRRSACASL